MPTVCILRLVHGSMHITRRMNIMHTTTSLVDIDNPDFWKKMVGEAQVEENGKHRWQEKEGAQCQLQREGVRKKLNMSLKVENDANFLFRKNISSHLIELLFVEADLLRLSSFDSSSHLIELCFVEAEGVRMGNTSMSLIQEVLILATLKK